MLTKWLMLAITLSTVSLCLLTEAVASTGNMFKSITDMYDRQRLRSSYALYIDRDMQAVVERVGWQITQHLPKRATTRDYSFILLDSHSVDVFHSDSRYDMDLDSSSIYLTRGLIVLANHEGHLAAAIALKVAQFENDKIRPGHVIQRVTRAVSELAVNKKRGERIFQRAAKLMAQANYDPAALLDWVLLARRYQDYQQKIEQDNEQLRLAYLNFSERQFTQAVAALKKEIASLRTKHKVAYTTTSTASFMAMLDGLIYSSALEFQLTAHRSIALDQSGIRFYLPRDIQYVESEQAQKMFPFNFVALGQRANSPFAVAYQYNSQNTDGYSAVMAWVVIDEVLSIPPAKRLTQYINDITQEFDIVQQQTIRGQGWRGHYINAEAVIEYSSNTGNGVMMNNVHFSGLEAYALVPLAGKTILIRQGPLIDEAQFLSLVTNIRTSSAINQNISSPATEYQLVIKTVQADDTMASLSGNLSIDGADNLLRALNGLPWQSEPVAGQLIKVIEAR